MGIHNCRAACELHNENLVTGDLSMAFWMHPSHLLLRLPGVVIAISCLAFSGCSNDSESLAKVNGRVTFNGAAAAAEITFEPIVSTQASGRTAMARTDANGNFTLHYTTDQPGAVIGMNRVVIQIQRSGHGDATDNEPRDYEEAVGLVKLVRLNRTVRSGKNWFDFAITY